MWDERFQACSLSAMSACFWYVYVCVCVAYVSYVKGRFRYSVCDAWLPLCMHICTHNDGKRIESDSKVFITFSICLLCTVNWMGDMETCFCFYWLCTVRCVNFNKIYFSVKVHEFLNFYCNSVYSFKFTLNVKVTFEFMEKLWSGIIQIMFLQSLLWIQFYTINSYLTLSNNLSTKPNNISGSQ